MNEVSQGEEFVHSLLSHGTSKYYDPVKAREYYLRTRELKGRRSGNTIDRPAQKTKVVPDPVGDTNKRVSELQTKAQNKKAILRKKVGSVIRAPSANNKRVRVAKPKAANTPASSSRLPQATTTSSRPPIEGRSQRQRKAKPLSKESRKIGEELKAAVDTARSKYEGLRAKAILEYEAKRQNEHNALVKATMSKS
jgi:hypothetical protein